MKILTKLLAVLLLCAVLSVCGCSVPSYEDFQAPEQGKSTLKPTGDLFVKRNYKDKQPKKEKTTARYSVGGCVIEKKNSYYDVTLDYSKGSHREIGSAYAQTLQKACPELMKLCEDYLYDLLGMVFYEKTDYSFLKERAVLLKNSLDKAYRDELDGSAEVLCSGHSFKQDKRISFEEFYILNMIPDAVRSTSCSAMTVNGNKTKTGHRIASRILEWDLGEDNQLTKMHCVIHYKNGSKSFTSVGLLGMHNILTAVSDDGIMIGIFDVGSSTQNKFTAEGRTCYSYALRYAIENYSSLEKIADYMLKNSNRFTYNHSILLCDDKNAVCVEDVVDREEGKAVIRDSSTPLNNSLSWDDPDCFCIVNSYAAKGNTDMMYKHPDNITRWKKYNNLFCGAVKKSKIDVSDYKNLLTAEKLKDSPVENIRSEGVVHILLTDFSKKSIQAVFTPQTGVEEEPEFIDIGSY